MPRGRGAAGCPHRRAWPSTPRRLDLGRCGSAGSFSCACLILVLDKGRITETGTHPQLLARRGLYAELYELQAQGYR